MVVYSDFWVNFFTLGNGEMGAVTIFPFIFIRKRYATITDLAFVRKLNALINHEKIHFRQYLELGVIFFYIFYVLNWLLNVFLYKLYLEDVYLNVVFEIEAYKEQENSGYLENRKFWAWRHYWKMRGK